jgi:hypothetical protein
MGLIHSPFLPVPNLLYQPLPHHPSRTAQCLASLYYFPKRDFISLSATLVNNHQNLHRCKTSEVLQQALAHPCSQPHALPTPRRPWTSALQIPDSSNTTKQTSAYRKHESLSCPHPPPMFQGLREPEGDIEIIHSFQHSCLLSLHTQAFPYAQLGSPTMADNKQLDSSGQACRL